MDGSQGRSEYKTSQRLQPHERHAAPQGRGSGITAVDSVKGRESTEPIEDRADGYLRWFGGYKQLAPSGPMHAFACEIVVEPNAPLWNVASATANAAITTPSLSRTTETSLPAVE